jgi:hypothetical protein
MLRARWAAFGLAGVIALAGTGIIAARVAPFRAGPVTQPIAFPHDLHAGPLNQIPCMYCHSSADRSVDAGIPSVQVCAGCHMPAGAPLFRADSLGIKQLTVYWNEKRPIPWVRVYKIADHAHFPHMRHVKVVDLLCQDCHGPVETMRTIQVNQNLYMGWCINCHRQRQVRTDCAVCHY